MLLLLLLCYFFNVEDDEGGKSRMNKLPSAPIDHGAEVEEEEVEE